MEWYLFDDLDWPINTSRRFVSISWAYCFLLTFHRNHGPISQRFRDRRQFQSKISHFPHPLYLRPRWWADTPLRNWVAAQGVSKLEWWGKVKKFYDRFVRLDTIPAFDRRTDRHVAVAKTALCYASRGKDQRRYTTNLPDIVTDNSVVITLSAITILRYHLVTFFRLDAIA